MAAVGFWPCLYFTMRSIPQGNEAPISVLRGRMRGVYLVGLPRDILPK